MLMIIETDATPCSMYEDDPLLYIELIEEE